MTSPSGTESRFSEEHLDSNPDYNGYTFLSVRHWGEMANGDWTLKVADVSAGDRGTLQTASLKVLGTDPNAQTGYDVWIADHFPKRDQGKASIVGELADPDGDERLNLLEYALDTDPLVAEIGTGITAERIGDSVRVRYVADRSKEDITYVLKLSTNLAKWGPLSTTITSTNGSMETREAVLAIGSQHPLLFQLEITR